MSERILRRNVFPPTALTAGTVFSVTQQATSGLGVRLYVTVSSPGGSGSDSISLCAVPPNGNPPVPMATFSGATLLSTARTLVWDFYPGASNIGFTGTNAGTLANGPLYGVANLSIPLNWCLQIVLGGGNSATISIDAEILP